MNLFHKVVLTLGGMLVAASVAAERVQTFAPRNAGPNSERRTALVIGNSTYKFAPLRNPVNDARAMARILAETGFHVTLVEEAGRSLMRRVIRDWGDELTKGGVGLFYFAGHGMQIRGRNYLIPVTADVRREDEVEDESIDANTVLAKMDSARNSLNVMILDACRNNPFERSFRSVVRGLAQMDAPSGTLIAYATAPGSVAADGAGDNGVYTQHLLNAIRQPGLPVEQLFKQVRIGVAKDTRDQQIPWESSSLRGDFFFMAPVAYVGAANQQATIERAVQDATRVAKQEREDLERRIDQMVQEALAKQRSQFEAERQSAGAPSPTEPAAAAQVASMIPSPIATSPSTAASVQQGIVGVYQGEYFEPVGRGALEKLQAIALQILSAQNGNVVGKYVLASFGCRGTYEVEGTYRDKQLTLRTSGGPMRGCEQQITLTVQGNKLVGNTSAASSLRPGIELQKK